jgi:hypothetical protein
MDMTSVWFILHIINFKNCTYSPGILSTLPTGFMLDRFSALRFVQLKNRFESLNVLHFVNCIAYNTNAIIIIISAAKPRKSVAQGLTPLAYILKVLSSNLGRDKNYPEIFLLSSLSRGKWRVITSKLSHDRFLPVQFINNQRTSSRHQVAWLTDSTVRQTAEK